jgi:hypothetical protein
MAMTLLMSFGNLVCSLHFRFVLDLSSPFLKQSLMLKMDCDFRAIVDSTDVLILANQNSGSDSRSCGQCRDVFGKGNAVSLRSIPGSIFRWNGKK